MSVRILPLIAALAATLHAPAIAQSASANVSVTVRASVLKPLQMSTLQNLDFGTIVISNQGSFTGAVVAISQAGALTCAAALICTGQVRPARYQVSGTNRAVVTVSAPSSILTNQSDPTRQLTMTLDAPSSVTMPNSGNRGVQFGVGGRITLDSTTAGGVYSGTVNVTVDYQ